MDSITTMGYICLDFAYYIFCYSGHLNINASNQLVEGHQGQQSLFDAPQSDMSLALGMSEESRTRFYQSWYDESTVSRILFWETAYQKWNRDEWHFLGEGEDLYWAIYYTIQQQTHFGTYDPANNYTLRGQGSWMDIILQNW